MTNVRFSRKEFEKEIKITKEIEEKISLFGTPLESLSEQEIEIEIFPNRPDLISLQGYLRGFKNFLGKEKPRKYKINKPEKDYKVIISPSVKEIRPFTACAIIKNLSFSDEKIKEIIDLQEKLHNTIGRNRKKVAIGIYPLEKIKLPIKYEALPPEKIKFIPLEFDKELTGLQILQKHPAGKEYAHLLQNYKEFPVFMDADSKVLSMPPIINSHETGKVSLETKEVFVECSGSDFGILKKTLNIIVTTLSDLGGKVYQMELNYGKNKEITPDLSYEKIKLSLENVNSLLGLKLKESEIEKLLAKMGHEYKNKSVSVPPWRTDILHEVDIIEDIAIAYGYNNFIPEIPNISSTAEESFESKIKNKISDILTGLGLIETSSYHLIKSEEAKILDLKGTIELENSKTDYKLLRQNLLIPSLRILDENKDNEYPQKFFEIGTVFAKDSNMETGIKESENLIIASSPGNFTEMKQILDYLAKMLSIKYEIKESSKKEFIEGRTGEIKINNKSCGFIGEIHPEILRAWSIKMPLSVLEISLDEIFKKLNLAA